MCIRDRHIAPPSSESPAYLNEYDLIRRSLNTLSKHSRDMENQYKIAEPFLQEEMCIRDRDMHGKTLGFALLEMEVEM